MYGRGRRWLRRHINERWAPVPRSVNSVGALSTIRPSDCTQRLRFQRFARCPGSHICTNPSTPAGSLTFQGSGKQYPDSDPASDASDVVDGTADSADSDDATDSITTRELVGGGGGPGGGGGGGTR